MRFLLVVAVAWMACADAPPAQEPTVRSSGTTLPTAPPVTRQDVEPHTAPPSKDTAPASPVWQLQTNGSEYVFELDARQFPARGLDPVLEIDGRRVTHYEYVSPTVLRFVVPAAIPVNPGARVTVQFGNDARTSRVLTNALELPRAGR